MPPTKVVLRIDALGPARVDSPIAGLPLGNDGDPQFVADDERILLDDRVAHMPADTPIGDLPALELAGPRRQIYFDAAKTRIGIVTCGGLCPGLNDVVRGLVMEAWHRYGVRHIFGFRYGYRGFIPSFGHEYLRLDPQAVSEIHESGGTMLGSSRGEQDTGLVVDCLDRLSINVLFVIGGDGTLRGGLDIADEVQRRDLKVAVIGIPKTIDNDILFLDQSFGFETAYSHAVHAIYAAHEEAHGAYNGIGLVKVMGRHSGFLACHAALATSHVNFVLIPEMPFSDDALDGFLGNLQLRLAQRHHAVILVAEGFGQNMVKRDGAPTDASGNMKLSDIGPQLAQRIKTYLDAAGMEHSLKYIDPSYSLRSVAATPSDSVYCWRLAQNAVHAAMCGKTRMLVGRWHGRMVHVPIAAAISSRNVVDTSSDLWLSVLETTGQPALFARMSQAA